jgi:hypothetical protein
MLILYSFIDIKYSSQDTIIASQQRVFIHAPESNYVLKNAILRG